MFVKLTDKGVKGDGGEGESSTLHRVRVFKKWPVYLPFLPTARGNRERMTIKICWGQWAPGTVFPMSPTVSPTFETQSSLVLDLGRLQDCRMPHLPWLGQCKEFINLVHVQVLSIVAATSMFKKMEGTNRNWECVLLQEFNRCFLKKVRIWLCIIDKSNDKEMNFTFVVRNQSFTALLNAN